MNWLDKLPGTQRSPHGLEWAVWKRLPAVLGWGTALPLAAAALVWWGAPSTGPDAPADASRLLMTFQLIGLVALHWTLVLTLAIGCIVVMVMKGPGYVADAFPSSEQPPRHLPVPASPAPGPAVDDGDPTRSRPPPTGP